jgi:hydrogenase nickel incorporation protein HypA/HybF
MHESSLARQILAAVLERAAREQAVRIRAVRGWVAETESLSPQSLAFHFAAHARGTAADGAHLDLQLVRVEARCRTCARTYVPEHHLLLCPFCGGTDANLLGRTGIGIETLEVE